PLPGRPPRDPLFAHAPRRRSTKEPFDMARPVPAEALAALRAAVGAAFHASGSEAQTAALRDLAWRAWVTEAETPAAHLETVNLMRLGSAAIAAQPDGVPVGGPGLDDLVARGVITREAFATPGGAGWTAMFDRYRPMLAATPTFVWTVGPDTRAAALAAGADWLRLNLAATGLGLALQPVSQALQEYPAMAPHFAEAHGLTGTAPPARLQMLGRLGYARPGAPPPRPTPRWPAESRIMGA
ncbi:hypothetical protein, partial [Neoroseomonas rubea]|uniref:hypothetical protein n=1 Tax=Neoroseomonas rubea TaxID=2748666 RepID=UPI001E489DB1